MEKYEAIAGFEDEARILLASYGHDKPRLRIAWRNYVAALYKNGQITPKQYHNWTGRVDRETK